MRLEPGNSTFVKLVAIAGGKIISGGNGLASGVVNEGSIGKIVVDLMRNGFRHVPEPGAPIVPKDTTIEREAYVAMFGPTVGDRVRLADTALWVEVEKDMVSALFVSMRPS